MSGVTELQPNVELFDTINFNSAFFRNINTGYLTFSDASQLFLQYPTAQGKETLQDTTVNGDLTVAKNLTVNGDYVQFPDGTQQTTAMVSLSPNTTYDYATVQTNEEGAISSITSGSAPVKPQQYAYFYTPAASGTVTVYLTFSDPGLYKQYDYVMLYLSFIVAGSPNYSDSSHTAENITTYNYLGRATCQVQLYPYYFQRGAGIDNNNINYILTNKYLGLSYTYNEYLQEANPGGTIDACIIGYCTDRDNFSFDINCINGSGGGYPCQSTLEIEIQSNSQPACKITGGGWTESNL